LYAVGGGSVETGALGTVEAYNPSTNTWTTKAAMPTPRDGHAIGVINGILYAVGGEGRPGLCGSGNPFSDICSALEAYNPSTNTWTTKASMLTRRYELGVGGVDGTLYAVGGVTCTADRCKVLETVEAYDSRTNMWTTKTASGTSLASMATPRTQLAVGVVGGTLYAVGGLGDNNSPLGMFEALIP
jgi:N-acetylneuraminic acid mutarotase